MAGRKTFRLSIISPERNFYEGDVEMVELNTVNGILGIYAEHIPLTTVLAPGVVHIYEDEAKEPKNAAICDGFVEILKDRVTVLVQSSEWPGEIDTSRAEEARRRAERRLSGETEGGEINVARAERALHRALARLELADGNMK